MNFFLQNYLKKNININDFRGLDRVEEIFEGLPDLLAMVCEVLFNKNKEHEAKGIYLRHKLRY